MNPVLATDLLSLPGFIILLAIAGVVAACFGKTIPAILCLGVALVLIVVK